MKFPLILIKPMQMIKDIYIAFAIYGAFLITPLIEVSFFSQIQKDSLFERSYCSVIITQLLSV